MLDPTTRNRLDTRALAALDRIYTITDPVTRATLTQQGAAVREYLYATGAEPSAAGALVTALEARVKATSSAQRPPKTSAAPASAPPPAPPPTPAVTTTPEATTVARAGVLGWWDTLTENERTALKVGGAAAVALALYAYSRRKKKR